MIQRCIAIQIDLDSRYTLVAASDVYRLQMSGRQVNVWTVNSVEKAYDLVNNLHVDMITTEYMLNSEQ
ncbi:unknown [Roseburia sp. CAG:309]|nr:unknown [Roseburia sp. CAG:309]